MQQFTWQEWSDRVQKWNFTGRKKQQELADQCAREGHDIAMSPNGEFCLRCLDFKLTDLESDVADEPPTPPSKERPMSRSNGVVDHDEIPGLHARLAERRRTEGRGDGILAMPTSVSPYARPAGLSVVRTPEPKPDQPPATQPEPEPEPAPTPAPIESGPPKFGLKSIIAKMNWIPRTAAARDLGRLLSIPQDYDSVRLSAPIRTEVKAIGPDAAFQVGFANNDTLVLFVVKSAKNNGLVYPLLKDARIGGKVLGEEFKERGWQTGRYTVTLVEEDGERAYVVLRAKRIGDCPVHWRSGKKGTLPKTAGATVAK